MNTEVNNNTQNNQPKVDLSFNFINNTFGTDGIAAVMMESVFNNKGVKVPNCSAADIKSILILVDQINALDRYTRNLNGTPLSEIDVPKWAAKLILPTEITYSVDLGDAVEDLTARPVPNREYQYNLGDIRTSAAKIAQTFKVKQALFVTADEARKARGSANLSSIIPVAAFGDKMSADVGKFYIPICLKSELTMLFSDYYFNDSANRVLREYILRTNVCSDES